MSTVYTNRDSNVWKTWVLMLGFFVLIMLVGWAVSYIYNDVSLLYIAVVLSVVMNIGSYWYSDKIVLSISGARPISRESHFELWNLVENLSITAGLPMPRVYTIADSAPNAFATGRNKEHAAVVVTTGLLSLLNKTELEGVVAHELAHIQNRDILLSTVVVVLVGFITLLSDFFLRMTLYGGGSHDKDNKANMFLMIAGIILLILSPFIALIMQMAISRKREFLADASGALLTRYPDGLASALQKISGYAGDMKHANHATAHLYIANPFNSKKSRTGFMTKLFMTHPPVEERIQALLDKKM